ncbi:bacteriohemerythrin [Thiorhodococcus mannitoliphagus]|uniref:Bacteriohemerythrin n=1 Tax=Thiorhodococcus mannitoliphagus TaxID=329406 RepID=A0A6P1DXQ2_9GAMM|nr:bacteriohemerythrin [Thiorhodococcus mannitoliphagus]NEX21853.1 bacteriohemerythrin [Thiorhodococcus mannitoliphagus]
MSYWSWDSSLSVGVEVIDGQHRRILDYINELDVARSSNDREKVSEVLMGLVDYTRTHFAFEEDMMKQAGYPLSVSHKRVHDAFVAHIDNYAVQHESGKDVTRKLMSELQIWLTNHIQNDDRDYAPYASKILNKSWLTRTLGKFFG